MANRHWVSPTLRRLRKERRLTLETVSLHTGIDCGGLSRKERQLARASDVEILKLAAFFGVEPREIRNEEGSPVARAAVDQP